MVIRCQETLDRALPLRPLRPVRPVGSGRNVPLNEIEKPLGCPAHDDAAGMAGWIEVRFVARSLLERCSRAAGRRTWVSPGRFVDPLEDARAIAREIEQA